MSSSLSHYHCLEPHRAGVRETPQLLLRLIGLPGVRVHDLAVGNVADAEALPAMGTSIARPAAGASRCHFPRLSHTLPLLELLLARPMDLVSQPPLIYSK